jgi:hypothetical protein
MKSQCKVRTTSTTTSRYLHKEPNDYTVQYLHDVLVRSNSAIRTSFLYAYFPHVAIPEFSASAALQPLISSLFSRALEVPLT